MVVVVGVAFSRGRVLVVAAFGVERAASQALGAGPSSPSSSPCRCCCCCFGPESVSGGGAFSLFVTGVATNEFSMVLLAAAVAPAPPERRLRFRGREGISGVCVCVRGGGSALGCAFP